MWRGWVLANTLADCLYQLCTHVNTGSVDALYYVELYEINARGYLRSKSYKCKTYVYMYSKSYKGIMLAYDCIIPFHKYLIMWVSCNQRDG